MEIIKAPVVLYRETAKTPIEPCRKVDKLSEAVDFVVDGFSSAEGAPRLKHMQREQLRCKIRKSADLMQLGLLVEVRLIFCATSLGFHREPTEADRHMESVQFIGIKRNGDFEYVRVQPSPIALALMSCAFSEGLRYDR